MLTRRDVLARSHVVEIGLPKLRRLFCRARTVEQVLTLHNSEWRRVKPIDRLWLALDVTPPPLAVRQQIAIRTAERAIVTSGVAPKRYEGDTALLRKVIDGHESAAAAVVATQSKRLQGEAEVAFTGWPDWFDYLVRDTLWDAARIVLGHSDCAVTVIEHASLIAGWAALRDAGVTWENAESRYKSYLRRPAVVRKAEAQDYAESLQCVLAVVREYQQAAAHKQGA